jgi:hypothetical protein
MVLRNMIETQQAFITWGRSIYPSNWRKISVNICEVSLQQVAIFWETWYCYGGLPLPKDEEVGRGLSKIVIMKNWSMFANMPFPNYGWIGEINFAMRVRMTFVRIPKQTSCWRCYPAIKTFAKQRQTYWENLGKIQRSQECQKATQRYKQIARLAPSLSLMWFFWGLFWH